MESVRSVSDAKPSASGRLAMTCEVKRVPGAVEVLGVSQGESYEVTVYTAAGERRVVLRGGADELGYRATVDAFLDMVAGAPAPVPWEQTRAVLEILASARART